LGLRADLPVLLVFGGSRGAHSINQAVSACLPKLLEDFQVFHVTGELDYPEVQKTVENLSTDQRSRYKVFPYLHEEMGAAFAAAALVVSRAGAATLGEYPLFGLPAILIPYPHAWRYQKVNAAYLASRGAAVVLPDERLNTELLPLVKSILGNAEMLSSMRKAMRALAIPDAANQIAGRLRELARKTPQKGLR